MKNKLAFLFILGSLFIFNSHCSTKPLTTVDNTKSADFSMFEEDILTKINQHRVSKGLSPLKSNSIITAEAVKHSKDMASGKTNFGHSGYDSRIGRIKDQLGNAKGSAENVATGSKTAEEVVRGWLNSPGHRQNIEGDFNLTGIGLARNQKGVLYYTQVFIKL